MDLNKRSQGGTAQAEARCLLLLQRITLRLLKDSEEGSTEAEGKTSTCATRGRDT